MAQNRSSSRHHRREDDVKYEAFLAFLSKEAYPTDRETQIGGLGRLLSRIQYVRE